MSVDPLEMFDRMEPPAGWSEPTDLEVDSVAARILERVLADDGSTVISLDAARRRRRAAAGVLVVTSLIAGGAVAAIWTRGPDASDRVACWSEAVDEPSEVLSLRWDGRADPAELCAGEWTAGAFGAAAPDQLDACLTDENTVAVLPGGGACDRLGLARFSPAIEAPASALRDAAAALDAMFFAACVPPDEAAAMVESVLEEYGLTGWDITVVGAPGAVETCATVALDASSSTANIVPVPRPD